MSNESETFERYIDCNCLAMGENLYNERYGSTPAANTCILVDLLGGGPYVPRDNKELLANMLNEAKYNCIWMKIHEDNKCHLLKKGCYYCEYLAELEEE